MRTKVRCKINGNARTPKLQLSKEAEVGFDLYSLFITSSPFLCTLWLDGEGRHRKPILMSLDTGVPLTQQAERTGTHSGIISHLTTSLY